MGNETWRDFKTERKTGVARKLPLLARLVRWENRVYWTVVTGRYSSGRFAHQFNHKEAKNVQHKESSSRCGSGNGYWNRQYSHYNEVWVFFVELDENHAGYSYPSALVMMQDVYEISVDGGAPSSEIWILDDDVQIYRWNIGQ